MQLQLYSFSILRTFLMSSSISTGSLSLTFILISTLLSPFFFHLHLSRCFFYSACPIYADIFENVSSGTSRALHMIKYSSAESPLLSFRIAFNVLIDIPVLLDMNVWDIPLANMYIFIALPIISPPPFSQTSYFMKSLLV